VLLNQTFHQTCHLRDKVTFRHCQSLQFVYRPGFTPRNNFITPAIRKATLSMIQCIPNILCDSLRVHRTSRIKNISLKAFLIILYSFHSLSIFWKGIWFENLNHSFMIYVRSCICSWYHLIKKTLNLIYREQM
jgi:hypothetical protein